VLRAIRELVVVLAVVLGLAFLAAFLYEHLGGATAHRAFTIVFYGGGCVLLVFSLLPGGGGGRARGGRLSRMPVRVRDDGRALNPRGALAVAAVLLLVLGGVFDTIL